MYEVIETRAYDKLRGIKKGMKCYIRALAFEYMGHKCYEVDMVDWVSKVTGTGMMYLYDEQLKQC